MVFGTARSGPGHAVCAWRRRIFCGFEKILRSEPWTARTVLKHGAEGKGGPGAWRVDETYIKVARIWTYLYRALDSAADTIDFMLSPKRDLTAAKLYLRLALSGTGGRRPRVINVDGHPAYTSAIAELKQSGDLGQRCRCQPSPYLNNTIEQDHRFIKKRIAANLGFRSPEGAWRTIEGYEAMHLIRKWRIRCCPKAMRWANASRSGVSRLRASYDAPVAERGLDLHGFEPSLRQHLAKLAS